MENNTRYMLVLFKHYFSYLNSKRINEIKAHIDFEKQFVIFLKEMGKEINDGTVAVPKERIELLFILRYVIAINHHICRNTKDKFKDTNIDTIFNLVKEASKLKDSLENKIEYIRKGYKEIFQSKYINSLTESYKNILLDKNLNLLFKPMFEALESF